ncbi:glycoside hydrolase family 3 N-terminal domain-containing protein [Chloroflexus sp.]|uniref:glycoside hydrolase family 3 N-terminal domain-containing protein n=1 Tax=Chloroflexus sp. TaxID=1904827 RepID=UPI00262318F9|nr:glycoside hydrolase family 3 N-terminal domain-containing protein [uncultured Chloroflexus sp.]
MNDIEERIDHLLGQMTLEEKIGQLNQPMIHGLPGLDLLRQGKAGSIINAFGALSGQGFDHLSSAEACNTLQKAALESRLGIPLLFGRDIIHGQRTVFPIPLAQAASFNPTLVEQINRVAAREASAVGIRWTFAPMLDIARDARWGRIAEGYGEDPYLTARMAEAAARGFQGDDVSQPDRLVACAKHYVGYGAAEGGRDYEQAEISEPTLRDVYLPPFRAAVAAGVGTVMSAFLDLNGVPATANRRLLTDILRGEWGFDGFVVSDWESIGELAQHGVAEDRAQAAALALHAGVDMDMVSGAYQETLAENLRCGRISDAELDTAVRRVLRIKHRAGIFERPFTDPERASRDILTAEARDLARQAARETMVLLKNDRNLLPLRDMRRILVAGPFVHATAELFGTWTMDGRAEDVVPLDQAFRQIAPTGVELWFAATPDLALSRAHYADAVILLMGEHPARSGENANVSDLNLPPGQLEWITAVAGIGKPTVLVVFAGRPLAITRAIAQVQAAIYAWHPGLEGAAALAEILFGLAAPSGRLPVSMPRATGQAPIYYARKPSGRPLREDGPFRTRYVDLPTVPLYPFGYGLTYTRFSYSDLRISSQRMRDTLTVSALITNVGERAGTEVVQLYIRDLVGSLTRPIRELKGFQRMTLQPGESRRVQFTLREEDLAFTRADGSWGAEPGRFKVWIAPHCEAGLEGEFML